MLNYIKSEMYRTKKNRSLIIFGLICMALLAAMVLVLAYFRKEQGFSYATAKFSLSFVYMDMSMMLLLTIVVAAIIDNNEYKNHTIKHSIAFGMKREAIYFARFISMVVNSVVVYVIISAFFALISFVFLKHANFLDTLIVLARVSLVSLPCLIAGVSITYFFLMIFDNPVVSISWIISVIIVIPRIMGLLGMKFDIFNFLLKYIPISCLASNGKMIGSLAMNVGANLTTILVGSGWTIAFLIMGMLIFKRREVK